MEHTAAEGLPEGQQVGSQVWLEAARGLDLNSGSALHIVPGQEYLLFPLLEV